MVRIKMFNQKMFKLQEIIKITLNENFHLFCLHFFLCLLESSSDLSYVFGSVIGAAEGFYIVDVKGEEHFESADNLQWNFIKGDKVRFESWQTALTMLSLLQINHFLGSNERHQGRAKLRRRNKAKHSPRNDSPCIFQNTQWESHVDRWNVHND